MCGGKEMSSTSFALASFTALRDLWVICSSTKSTTFLVGRIYGKYQMDCGFAGKSTKIGIVDVKEVLNDFRYSFKLNFSPGGHKMTKSKMATNRSVKI